MESLLIGLVSISDRASSGVYTDKGIPGLTEWFTATMASKWRMEKRLIPDERDVIERTLIELVDVVGCHLVLTTAHEVGRDAIHADGSDDPSGAITSQTSRGFTGHEELDSVGLVHMNGASTTRCSRGSAPPTR